MVPSRTPIGGLKISPPLCQIVMRPGARPPAPEIFRRLARRRINISMAVLETEAGRPAGSCCIDLSDLRAAETLLGPEAASIDIISPVAALTLYPHQNRLPLLQALLWAFGQAGLPVHAAASSLSALSIATDYARLEEALAAVGRVAELPPNHTPPACTLRVRQI